MKKQISTLVIDERALPSIGSASIEESWFERYEWPAGSALKRIVVGDTVYFLSSGADENSRLLIINAESDNGVFSSSENKQAILDRILHVALSRFERTISIPVNWHVYHDGSRLSVYRAIRSARDDDRRLYFEVCPRGNDHVFAYAAEVSRDFREAIPRLELYDHAIANYIEAATAPDPSTVGADGAYGVVLAAPVGADLVGSAGLDEWYKRKLTDQQRSFVDKPYGDPVRLKGAAGTGKTLAMVVKLLRDAYAAEDQGQATRFAFLTHSAAVAHETVPGMLDALDRKGRWRRLKHASIFIGSVYELAQDILQYDQKGLRPISTDGQEGREFQAAEVISAVERLKARPQFVMVDLREASPAVAEAVENLENNPRFLNGIMNEIACVLDAESIRLGRASADRYLSASRDSWQIDLPTERDRSIILKIHDEYRKEIEKSDYLSMDQMIADFNRYLEMHEWSARRDRTAFDVIFLDELHYFNRVERMVFHSLFTTNATQNGRVPLLMSYDYKQSPTDTFLGSGAGESAATFFQKLGIGETKSFELTQVFRSTPEITAFIADLDAAFPALDLEGEWKEYSAISNQPNGLVPTLNIYSNDIAMIDAVFAKASKDAGKFGGKNVAVICMNEEKYVKYLKVGRIEGKYVELSSRDQAAELRYAGKRCVFTMPDYVAGLQFDSVYVIHADRAELDSEASVGEKRRFISRLYLAVSRARHSLSISATDERGGAARELDKPVSRGSLRLKQ